MRIVLHIGLEKTGSTAIQRYCALDAAALAKAGALCPDRMGFRKQAAVTAAKRLDRLERASLRWRMRREIRALQQRFRV